MSARTEIRDAHAALAKNVLAQFGDTATYSNRGVAGVTVYCDPGEESKDLAEELGCDVEETARRFFIPRQTSFPPSAGIATSDTLVYPTSGGYTYFIKRWQADSLGAGYFVDAVREQPRRSL